MKDTDEERYAAYCKLFDVWSESEILKDQQEFATLLQAAEQGDAKAQYQVGERYLKGEKSVPRDNEQAIKWLEMLAQQGNARAMFHIGSYNERMAEESGTDVIQANAYMAEAAARYKLAAENGDKLGQIATQRLQA